MPKVCQKKVAHAAAAVAAAVAAESSLAAKWNVAKELVGSLDACADVWHVVSGAAMEVMNHLVAGVGFLLSLRDPSRS